MSNEPKFELDLRGDEKHLVIEEGWEAKQFWLEQVERALVQMIVEGRAHDFIVHQARNLIRDGVERGDLWRVED